MLWLIGIILALYLAISLVSQLSQELAIRKEIAKLRDERVAERAAVGADRAELEQRMRQLERDRAAFDQMRSERTSGFPWLADAWADYETLRHQEIAHALETKKHPARAAAEEVRAARREVRAAIKAAKVSQYLVAYYEDLFPWLTEYRDLSDEDTEDLASLHDGEADDLNSNRDPAEHWLSDSEYRALPSVERNQRALDHYLASRKSKWQVGRDYERYVGYHLERRGYRVEYRGALDGLTDMGRDLIAHRGLDTLIVQCKRWAQGKTIHEKHIFQLFGSMLEYQLAREEDGAQQTLSTVTGYFITSTQLSPLARRVADRLGIKVSESHAPQPYPLIKCNITPQSGERIYHLPFDQQYDRVKIDERLGEMFCMTVAEAEASGFRRAFRWKGN